MARPYVNFYNNSIVKPFYAALGALANSPLGDPGLYVSLQGIGPYGVPAATLGQDFAYGLQALARYIRLAEVVGEERAFGDLTVSEIDAILNIVNEAGRPLDVVGSAARGTRRGIGTDLPIGKGPGTRSDIDYLFGYVSAPYFSELQWRLPSIDREPGGGVVGGIFNPHMGPSVRFEPGVPPYFIPEK
jgi:hypothetical protein